MIIVLLLTMVFPIICISFSSPTNSLWLNWLYISFLSSDKKKIISTKYSAVQTGHFIILSVAADQKVLFGFFFPWRKMNFKGLKVHVLKHEMHNNIVLMASAVGWTLQEKNEKVTCNPTSDDALYPFDSIHPFSWRHLLLSCALFPCGGQAQQSVLA